MGVTTPDLCPCHPPRQVILALLLARVKGERSWGGKGSPGVMGSQQLWGSRGHGGPVGVRGSWGHMESWGSWAGPGGVVRSRGVMGVTGKVTEGSQGVTGGRSLPQPRPLRQWARRLHPSWRNRPMGARCWGQRRSSAAPCRGAGPCSGRGAGSCSGPRPAPPTHATGWPETLSEVGGATGGGAGLKERGRGCRAGGAGLKQRWAWLTSTGAWLEARRAWLESRDGAKATIGAA